MSNTTKTHRRFWESMGERFGKRWLDEYGSEPTLAWRELLDRYNPREIKAALELMHQRALQHPPTEPQFAELLNAAQAKAKHSSDKTAADYRRDYWRSTIVHEVATRLGYDFGTFEPVLIANKTTLGASMRLLLDEVDDLESRTGQRTPGMEAMCGERCRRIAASFASLRQRVAA